MTSGDRMSGGQPLSSPLPLSPPLGALCLTSSSGAWLGIRSLRKRVGNFISLRKDTRLIENVEAYGRKNGDGDDDVCKDRDVA